jgi:hypothetical protein
MNDALERIKEATLSLKYAMEMAANAMAEIQIAASELEPHQAKEFELIAYDAISRARDA